MLKNLQDMATTGGSRERRPHPASTAVLGVAAAMALTSSAAHGEDVAFEKVRVQGVSAQVVTVNLRSPRVDVRPMVAGSAPLFAKQRARSFSSMIAASKCLAAINGTFFDIKTRSTLGTMVYNGKIVSQGFVGNALAVNHQGEVKFVKLHHTNNKAINWSPYRFAIGAGPSLIEKGLISVNPHDEGFKDRHLCGVARRSALGFTKEGKMLMVTVPQGITLSHLARVMRSLRAWYALNLDGGTSSALYYRGSYITRPGRTLTNILGVRVLGSKPEPAMTLRLQGPAAREIVMPEPIERLLAPLTKPSPTSESHAASADERSRGATSVAPTGTTRSHHRQGSEPRPEARADHRSLEDGGSLFDL